MTTILAMDTSQRRMRFALYRDHVELYRFGTSPDQAEGIRGQALTAEAFRAFHNASLSPRELDLIAVSTGPGSFTSLRVGIVFAKTFAYASGCSIVAVDTFAAIATASPPDTQRVAVVEDAQRNGLFAAIYEFEHGRWQASRGLEVVAADELVTWIGDPATPLTGPALARFPELCQQSHLPPECWIAEPRHLAAIAALEFAAGRTTDPQALVPVYGRRSAAEEKRDRNSSDSSSGKS